jgi:hypothetical protein
VSEQVLDMGGAAVGVVESVLGSSIEEAFTPYSGRTRSGKCARDNQARETH